MKDEGGRIKRNFLVPTIFVGMQPARSGVPGGQQRIGERNELLPGRVHRHPLFPSCHLHILWYTFGDTIIGFD
jgi:hypothetical protein